MSNKTVFSHLEDEKMVGVPDGLCQDDEHGVWSARWGSGKVIRLDEHGQPDVMVEFPTGLNQKCCIFGGTSFGGAYAQSYALISCPGPNMDELYVTSAAAETPELAKQHPRCGHLFAVKGLGYRGIERTRFKATFKQKRGNGTNGYHHVNGTGEGTAFVK